MAKLGTAWVNIRANLKPLKEGLRLAKSVVSRAMASITAAVKKMISITKRAMLGFLAVSTAATYAAMKQEQAEFELAAALKVTGQYSEKVMKALKAQAAEVQNATVYGDEYVMTLQRMAINQGLAADKATEAAKAAIGLYKAYGGGRGKPEVFLRYYIGELKGTTKSLTTYVTTLGAANTEQERQAILLKAAAQGYKIATAEAESAYGALKQIKNIIGDIAEIFGQIYLENIKRLRDWMKENKQTMEMWAEKTGVWVKFVKDIFFDFVKWLSTDWKANLKTALQATIPLWEAFGKSIIKIMDKVWSEIGNRAIVAGSRAMAKYIEYQREYDKILIRMRKEAGWTGMPFTKLPTAEMKTEAKQRARERVAAAERQGVFKIAFPTIPTKPFSDIAKEIKLSFEKAWPKTLDKLPDELKDPIDKHFKEAKEKIAAITEKYKKAEAAAAEAAAKAGAPGVGAPGAPPGVDMTRLGFVGIKEAWRLLAKGLTIKKDEIGKKIYKEQQKTTKELKTANTYLKNVKNLGTVGA